MEISTLRLGGFLSACLRLPAALLEPFELAVNLRFPLCGIASVANGARAPIGTHVLQDGWYDICTGQRHDDLFCYVNAGTYHNTCESNRTRVAGSAEP